MKKKKIVINGQFAARKMTGQERFAYEVVSALDKIVTKNLDITLVTPTNAFNIPSLNNIKIVRFGRAKGSAWEQIFLATYSLWNRALTLNLCTCMPLLNPGIICIHDLASKEHPEWFKTIYKKTSRIWHLLIFNWAWFFSPTIITVSEYSKKRIVDIYKINPDRIAVIPNGWEHFRNIQEDYTIFKNKQELFNKPFFFSLGSLAPNKNIGWIIKVAQHHPQYNFLIAGNANKKIYGTDYSKESIPNVFFLGYIQDGEVKFLMKKCQAFLFPSLFEGFGIPPLEALSVGTKIIISNATCLPEIFGNTAHYIDPYNTDVNIDKLMAENVEDADKVLKKYTYENAATLLKKILLDYLN